MSSRRHRRDREAARLAAETVLLTVDYVTAAAKFDYVRSLNAHTSLAEVSGRLGRARKADGRRRRARVVKRIASRSGAQHYPRKRRRAGR